MKSGMFAPMWCMVTCAKYPPTLVRAEILTMTSFGTPKRSDTSDRTSAPNVYDTVLFTGNTKILFSDMRS
jgi:hypothetical protein